MAVNKNPNAVNGNPGLSVNLLPKFYQTSHNKKFLQSTIDQLFQSGSLHKVSGLIGRENAKASKGTDVYVEAADLVRQNYQLEPGITIKDSLGNVTYFKDYIDYINQLNVFGGNTSNHARINKQEFYSWDPHIDWDKFVNFQNYYWLPYGPDPITVYGDQQAIDSTFTVTLQNEGANNQYVFTPDGVTPNPVIKLYKGQTYTFNINSPGNPFSFVTQRSTGNLYRYKTSGIDNYGVTSGSITFTVPVDAPSIIYYQSETDLNLGGAIQIFNITSDTIIDVEKVILGKQSVTLNNGVTLSNGMKLQFSGTVIPSNYAIGQYYVEGVGTSIKLVLSSVLEVVSPYTTEQSIEFDNLPWDSEPFDNASGYAGSIDYITINRASSDHNPWSRYNRWFHKDVIDTSAIFNNSVARLDQTTRAVRPIIEFDRDLKLFNLGTTAIADIDLIDTFTIDAFSTIEGTSGYNIDGVDLVPGMLVLFAADIDPLVQNKIYRVEYVDVNHLNSGSNQLHLVEVATPSINQVTLVKQGTAYQSQMFWFDGKTWIQGQQKTKVNQPPLFDIFDNSGVSFGNNTVYTGSTFVGTPIFSYKVGNGTADSILGFPLTYQNVSNIGDIVFSFNLVTDSFEYKKSAIVETHKIDVGYLSSLDYAGNIVYLNGWKTSIVDTVQAAIRIYKNSGLTNNFPLDIFDNINKLSDLVVKVYINGIRLDTSLWKLITKPTYYQVLLKNSITTSDVLTIRAFSEQPINSNGYYEVPLNLQNNPLNNEMIDFTLGEVTDHVTSIVDNLPKFKGSFPGDGNLRDLGGITQYGTKFVQHSGPLSLGIYHITSETNNVVKAVEQAKTDYNNFKQDFINIANSLGVDGDTVTIVDKILNKLNGNKPTVAPYYLSDMVPYGATIITNLTVVDYRIKEYPLSAIFDLNTLSNKAVGVYLNKIQLIYGQDYVFNTQGFVVIDSSVPLVTGDTISTYEYDNTDGSFVPATPTKLGMWPAFIPKKYLDTTLINPVNVIQGHDGSIVSAYNDFRDDLILELEKRIFNNIKVKYNPDIFDISKIIPSYSRKNAYSREEFNKVLAPNFYTWTGFVGKDLTTPLNYDRSNSFSYNYSLNAAPNNTSLPGYWRGIYRYILDTDRPHICPWEMLGFSQQPSWWTSVYGPAPYTSDNLLMWKDISDGMIREPNMPATYTAEYAKPFLMDHIPVDESGNLTSPLQSGLASGTVSPSINNNFVFGDGSPVESAWARSSYYPFSVIVTSLILTPGQTFGVLLDRSRIQRNIAGQLIYSETGLRISPADIILPSTYSSSTRVQTAGLINWIVDLIFNYIFSNNVAGYKSYKNDLDTMQPQLSYRVGSFTNQSQFNLLLESKTPSSTGNVFVPTDDYTVFLNKSTPVKKLVYSGVIVTKLTTGFEVKGYSKTQPYFSYYQYQGTGISINVGGISENYTEWTSGQLYTIGTIVQYNGVYYRSTATSTSSDTFNFNNFVKLNGLPMSGGVVANLRNKWDRTKTIEVPYGTLFPTIQSVVDFLQGYGEFLKDEGFTFDNYNSQYGTVNNWDSSVNEFLFWTTQNWSTGQEKWSDWAPNQSYTYGTVVRYNGDYYSSLYNLPITDEFDFSKWQLLPGLSNVGASVISLSPSANGVNFITDLSVVEDISSSFNPYEILKVDGTPIEITHLHSYREGNEVTYVPTTLQGIYGASFYLIQNEHVIVINNTTIFNDIIYSPTSGYRRERLKVSGYITTDWYGGLDIPGFIYDAAAIQTWQPWKDYSIGDIVKHGPFYLQANPTTGNLIAGSASFDQTQWTRLSSKPSDQILPNWTNIATQFTDFYSTDVDSFDNGQQKMAQHLIGYQKRQYLENIIQDDVSEFKFYQGMIKEKGTQNVLNKLFDVLSSDNEESLTFYEEWAVRVGRYGATSAFDEIEFILNQNLFKNNPQGIALVDKLDATISPFIIQQIPSDIYIKPMGYDSNPFIPLSSSNQFLRSAGYVDANDVTIAISSLDSLSSQSATYITPGISYIILTLGTSDFTLSGAPTNVIGTSFTATGTGNGTGTVSVDITKFREGSYVWCSFDSFSGWDVYRFTDLHVRFKSISLANNILTITSEDMIPFKVGSYIGISQTTQLNGWYQVQSVNLNTFTVSTSLSSISPAPTSLLIYGLISQRTPSIDTITSIIPVNLKENDLIWTDDRGDGISAAWAFAPVYNRTTLANTNATIKLFGNAVAVNTQGNMAAVTMSTGQINTYDKIGLNVSWIQRQLVSVPFTAQSSANSNSVIATVVAISPDGSYMASGSPYATSASTFYVGVYNSSNLYIVGQIVSYQNNFYKAVVAVPVGAVPSTNSTYWTSIPYIPVDLTGTNISVSGLITLYKKDSNNIYQLIDTIISPSATLSIASAELYGSILVFDNNNNLYITAPGYNNSVGKVYSLSYTSTPIIYYYDSVGSSDNVLNLNSTYGIRSGMSIAGTGFTKNQKVASVLTEITFSSIADVPNYVLNSSGVAVSLSNITTGLTVTGTGVQPGVSVYQSGTTPIVFSVLSVTPSSPITGYVTLTFATQSKAPFLVGDQIAVSNISVAGYNGNYTVSQVSTNSVSYANITTTAAQPLTGSVQTNINYVLVSGNEDAISTISSVAFTINILGVFPLTPGAGLVTITFGMLPVVPFKSGDRLTVSGVSVSGYNGTFSVVTSTTTSVTFYNSTTTTSATGGIIANSSLIFNVRSIASPSIVLLTAPPDSSPTVGDEPVVELQFYNINWLYTSLVTTPQSLPSFSYFGKQISVSYDGSTILTSSSRNVYISKIGLSAPGLVIPVVNTNFGQNLAISNAGDYIAIGDFAVENNKATNNGQVRIYQFTDGTYNLFQTITDPSSNSNGSNFANKIAFMNDSDTLVIYSQTGSSSTHTTFDIKIGTETTFDERATRIISTDISGGRVDIYDNYNTQWVLSESLLNDESGWDGYGIGFATGANNIFVSSPYYNNTNTLAGQLYIYTKSPNNYSWTNYRTQSPVVDIKKLKKAFLYNKNTSTLLTYLDVIDPIQGKIAGPADEEIKYKSFYDPAVYSYSSNVDIVNLDSGIFWSTVQVGQLWWDLRTAKFYDPYFADISYRNNVWNTLAPGASIDIYEWVQSTLLPDAWDAVADTIPGLAQGISGTSLYGNNAYSVRKRYDTNTKTFKNTYYFWVKNKAVTPSVLGRKISAQSVSMLIRNPRSQGYSYLALTGTNSVSLVNIASYLANSDVVLAVEYWNVDNIEQNIHSQWKLISNDTIVNIPKNIEQKWIDSLCGADTSGRAVPETNLPPKLRYGIENRPRQSMFVNRVEALKEFVEQVNADLLSTQIVNNYNISKLESYDVSPTLVTALYDVILDTDLELPYANINLFQTPSLVPIITNGRLTGITIISTGRGYIVAPYINIVDTAGIGATAKAIINSAGSIVDVTILSAGKGYNPNTTTCSVRSYSVLVQSDTQALGNWSIYAYDPTNILWSRTLTQSFDVRNYWSYADWYSPGYNQFSSADFSIQTFFELSALTVSMGQLVKVLKVNSGGWILIEKYSTSTSTDWTQSYTVVGIQNGTIQLSNSLFETQFTAVGYDASTFDNGSFDVKASSELRIIFDTLKNDIFVGSDLKQTYLNLFFNSIRYAHSEQLYLDWVFKTSFVRATHNVGSLNQPVYYPVDNLSNFQDYIAEVKPYRTKIREYISQYVSIDANPTAVGDFDLQPVIQNKQSLIINTAIKNGVVTADNASIREYPWKFWLDNVGFTVTELIIVNGGSDYITQPQVVIDAPTGPAPIQATASAFFTNGVINRIILTSSGNGYLTAPSVQLVGGLSKTGTPATIVAIIGNGVVRSNLIGIKFDRVSSKNFIIDLSVSETFTGSGSRLQFPLIWAPNNQIGQSTVYQNGNLVLRENYTLSIEKTTTNGYTQYSGAITFTTAPDVGTLIVVNYIKDISILNATDRIEFYYNPTNGMIGKELNQLMSGVDYGGNIVGNLGFIPGGGWGVLPYMADTWSKFDNTYTDYIVQVSANTHSFTLPYTPIVNTQINIYHQSGYSISYPSDGITTAWPYDLLANLTSVTISTTLATTSSSNITSTLLNFATTTQASLLSTGGTSGQSTIIFDNVLNVIVGQYVSGNGVLTNTKVIDILGSSVVISNNLTSDASGSYSFYELSTALTVSSLNGILVGSGVVGTGFSVQAVSKILSSTVDGITSNYVYLNSAPDFPPTLNETLTFVTNVAGSTTLTIASTANLQIGDVVTTADLAALSYNTTVITILNSTQVILSKILYKTVPNGTSIVFTRTLPTADAAGGNGQILLTAPALVGSDINILGNYDPIRIDAEDFNSISEISLTNSNAIMLTPVIGVTPAPGIITIVDANGNRIYTINIPNTFAVVTGDKFILRQSTSDGSQVPNDYDTDIDGGNLAYSTARGIAADDIVLDGDGFATPTSSPALEEVVPGQIVDTLAIKIYDRPNLGSANIHVDNYITDGYTNSYKLLTTPSSAGAIIVRVGSSIKTINIDYQIDYKNNLLVLASTPTASQVISIFVIGFSGSNILDLDYFVGDGLTTEFVTKAHWIEDFTALVYVNGVVVDPVFFKTDNTYSANNVIGIKFASPVALGSLINYIIVSGTEQTFSVTNSEIIATNGGSVYTLVNPIGVSLPNETNMIVRANQQILKAPVNVYYTIQDNILEYTLDPTIAQPYSVSAGNVTVLVDGNTLISGADYSVDLSGLTVIIGKNIYNQNIGKTLLISITANQGYFYNPSSKQITFTQAYSSADMVVVTSSYRHDTLDIQRTAVTVTSSSNLTPGSVQYYYYQSLSGGRIQLNRSVINENYIWVVQNTTLLIPGIDYILLDDLTSIQLTAYPSLSDQITLITFGSNVLSHGIAYMQFKDMLNKTSYTRLSLNKQTTLATDLSWNDTIITLVDGSNFQIPGNTPGIIEIRGERIEYYAKTGNVLSKLRRGVFGTGTYTVNYAGTFVQDISSGESIPYSDSVQTTTVLSDGSNIVNLNFTPVLGTTEDPTGIANWFTDYGYTYQGSFSLSSTYAKNDVVVYNNSYYYCKNSIVSLANRLLITTPTAKIITSQYLDVLTIISVLTGSVGISQVIQNSSTQFVNQLSGSYGGVGTYTVSNSVSNFNLPISSITNSNGAVTLHFVTQLTIPFAIKTGIYVTGITPISYNGYYIVTDATTSTVTYANASTLPATGGNVSATTLSTVIMGYDYSPDNSYFWTKYPTTIPVGYGQSDQLEVFVGGYNDTAVWSPLTSYTIDTIVNVGSYTYKCTVDHVSSNTFTLDTDNWSFFVGNIRLQKRPYSVFNINKAPYSPAGDVVFDADFAVDGTSNQIRLTNKLDLGTYITIVKRTGTLWDSNSNILNDTGKIGSLIKSNPGIWYSTYKQISNTATLNPLTSSTLDNSTASLDNNFNTFDQG